MLGPTYDDIRLDTDSLQLFYARLRRFRFHFTGSFQIWNQGNVDQNGVLVSDIVLELADRLQERLAFDIADGSADLNDGNTLLVYFFSAVETALDFVCNVRNDLYGASAEITVAFFLQNRPVYFSGRHVGIFIQALVNETLVVAKIQVCLCAVIGNENLAVLNRVHRTRVNVDVRVKFLHCHFVSSGF